MRPLRFALLLAFGAFACGPSFQAVYECDVHFEHCYALDEGPALADAKEECWRAWLRGYTYGQSRDRVEYAAMRFSQLSLGPTLPSEEARDARPRRRAPGVAAAVPTNAFAPPPNLAASAAAAPSTAPGAGTQPPIRETFLRTPAADCSEACAQHWTACREACDAVSAAASRRGQDEKDACPQCDRTYRTCVPACFREEQAAHPPSRGSR